MSKRIPLGEGNGHSKGLIDIVPLREGCSIFVPNPQQPPPPEEMPQAITDVLYKWMAQQPVKILHTLPITKNGNTVSLIVCWERVAPPTPPERPA
jgi:hypothetical protein